VDSGVAEWEREAGLMPPLPVTGSVRACRFLAGRAVLGLGQKTGPRVGLSCSGLHDHL
jgi:hypothetical protein